MSPARARTSSAEIMSAARAILETDGLDAVTMQAVADRVGVRAPSLYKRFASRAALLTAVADDVAAELGEAIASSLREADPGDAIRSLAMRFRAFGHSLPGAYRLLFSDRGTGTDPGPGIGSEAAVGLLALTERLVGRDRALDAARFLTAFAHGFVSMELAGAFRLGGDVDKAFDFSIEAIVAGLRAPHSLGSG